MLQYFVNVSIAVITTADASLMTKIQPDKKNERVIRASGIGGILQHRCTGGIGA